MILIKLSSSVNIRSFNSACSKTSSKVVGSILSALPSSSISWASKAQSYSFPLPNTSNNCCKLSSSTSDNLEVSNSGPCLLFSHLCFRLCFLFFFLEDSISSSSSSSTMKPSRTLLMASSSSSSSSSSSEESSFMTSSPSPSDECCSDS
ncbi:hypothetical protein CANTEDRAFT_119485 [Yamadazyma tenuis ATCC 10573]|uniref:Uncharacterized protein n=1 Tax=Candida tenuis (strain ATCC 10573 / BCRC 21748 / CBS 615 / JCM 9827 / NBRC 10315 / NRRL Y-1498 / VKM Y-70) TaxID=590646 RepID=G3B017_CANTC|nr:uncharacterized protein CANTEDRAFT_119485 [Yamadazyma tenuis ATCC 10573]EGV65290.1 hypothetical protein CANTEDRAFT_119485 [Yamadazyma tenuis ATCC 10573]